jgi:hypothetical protein
MTDRTRNARAALIVLLVAVPIYALRLNDAAGLVVDDAWYVMLGSALAGGQGYQLINAPVDGILPGYPPGFPAILSIVFRVLPKFPQNVWLLKSLSVMAMLGVGILTYVYAKRRQVPEEVALCAALGVTVTPAFVFLATSTVMTECIFTLLQLATVLLIHRGGESRDAQRAQRLTAVAGLTAAATVLIRSAGIALPLAAGLWLVKERLWKRAVLFAAITILGVLPWIAYAHWHAPTPAQQSLHGGSIVYSYGEQIWMRWAGYPAAGAATVDELPARVGTNVVDVVFRGAGGVFVPALFRGPAESGEEIASLGGALGLSRGSMGAASGTMGVSFAIAAIMLVGFVRTSRTNLTVAELLVPATLGIIVVWPFWTFRFILPLAPYLFVYLVRGLRTFAPAAVARVALLCLFGLNVLDHARYVLHARDAERTARVSWLAQARETDEVLDWITRNLDDGVIATTNPGLVYLRTGHKTIAFDRPHDDFGVWKARGVRYVVSLLPVQPPASSNAFKLLYRSSEGMWVIEI